LNENGVEVYYAPTPDFHPVELLELLRITRWIDERIRRGSRILVHCMGGIGRSGLVAAAYLVYRGKNLYDAYMHVSSIRPGAIENIGQRRMLEDYSILLETLGDQLDSFINLVDLALKNSVSLKHVSKSVQFTIELSDYLRLKGLRENILASAAHCIPIENLAKNDLRLPIIDCLRDYSVGTLGTLCGTLVFISHTLDLGMDGRVVILSHDRIDSVNYITLLCDGGCTPILKHERRPMDRLERLIGEKIILRAENYMDYI
jgi:hypothetical protein